MFDSKKAIPPGFVKRYGGIRLDAAAIFFNLAMGRDETLLHRKVLKNYLASKWLQAYGPL